MSVDECSVKFVGSVINCFMLYSCIRTFILLLLTLSMFMLKYISYVGAKCHVDTFINGGKIVCVTVRGSVKPSDEDWFGLCLTLNPHSLYTRDFQVSSALAG